MLATKLSSPLQQRAAIRPFAPARRCATIVQARKLSLASVVADVAKLQLKKELPPVQVGDSVRLGLAVVEGQGDKVKSRTQKLDGVIIRQHGAGIDKTLTFRRVFQGVGIELTLPVHSPAVQNVEIVKRGRVRRAKLYYLRERRGKSARLTEVLGAMKALKEAEKAKVAAAAAQQ